MNKQARGFNATALIIAVCLVGLVGVIGWRIWQAQTKDTAAEKSSSTASDQTDAVRDDAQSAPQDGTEYLQIPELGVKIPLPAGVSDIQYVVDSHDNTEDVAAASVTFSSQELIDLSGGMCSAENAPLGLLTVFKGTVGSNDQPLAESSTAFKIGGRYFQFAGPQAQCSTDSDVNDLQATQLQAFSQVIRDLQEY